MKKILILNLFFILQLSAQENPTSTETQHYLNTESDMIIKGYSDTPKNSTSIEPYKPSYENKTSEYVRNLSKSQEIRQEYNGGTLEKIIEDDKKKIDINGGYVKANDAYIKENGGRLKPKNDVYKPDVNNDEYNAVLQEQELKKDFKNVKNILEELLPLILMLVIIIAVIYLIIYLRRKTPTNPFQ